MLIINDFVILREIIHEIKMLLIMEPEILIKPSITATHHNQIDQRYRIQRDIPQPHDSGHVDNQQQDHKHNHQSEY